METKNQLLRHKTASEDATLTRFLSINHNPVLFIALMTVSPLALAALLDISRLY